MRRDTACAARRIRLSGMPASSSVSSVFCGCLELDFDRIGQRDGLKNRAKFVKPVGAFIEHPQIEIDFRERTQLDGSRH